MAAVLFAGIAASLPLTPDRIVDGPVHAHGGSVLRAEGDEVLAVFERAVDAVACALSIRSGCAERNRAQGPSLVGARFFVYQAEENAVTGPSESTLQRAAAVGRLTPAGRVFVSRPIYLDSRGASLFAFVPLGSERFSGFTEPVDVFEAMPATGRGWILPASIPTPSAARRTPTAPPPVAAWRGNAVVPASWITWAGALIVAVAGFALQRLVLALLTPVHIVNDVVGLAGTFVFGATGSESGAVLGGLLLPLALPTAASVYSLVEQRPVLARWSIFWTGTALASVGSAVVMNTDPESLASILRLGLMELLGLFGAGASAARVAQGALLCGCLLMAVAGAAALRAEPREKEASTGPNHIARSFRP